MNTNGILVAFIDDNNGFSCTRYRFKGNKAKPEDFPEVIHRAIKRGAEVLTEKEADGKGSFVLTNLVNIGI